MIIYASMTNTSIGGLFAAGLIPGVVLATAFMVMGPDSTRAFLARRPDIRAYIIYNDNGERRMWASKGVE